MRTTRSKLLITLVLFGVLSAAAARAQTSTINLGKAPEDPLGKSSYLPNPIPNAGEPDVGQTGPNRLSMRSVERSVSQPAVPQQRVQSLASAFRLAWVIWMARYLNLAP